MNRIKFKKLLRQKTQCWMQHDWRPCWTCFFSISEELNNQDRQAVLLYRWDYKKEDLNNLPDDIEKQLERVEKIFLNS